MNKRKHPLRRPESLKEFYRNQSHPQVIHLNSPCFEEIEEQLNTVQFFRVGEHWRVGFRGNTKEYPNSKGLEQIHFLMINRGYELSCEDVSCLTVAEQLNAPAAKHNDDSGPQVDFDELHPTSLTAFSQEILDERAKKAITDRLLEIRAQRQKAETEEDTEQMAILDEEIEAISKNLAASTYSGRTKKFNRSGDRVRKAVTKTIKAAIECIWEDNSALGAFLEDSISTGFKCIYVPVMQVEHVLKTPK